MRPGSIYLMEMEAAGSVTPIKMSILTMEHAAFVIPLRISFRMARANPVYWLAAASVKAQQSVGPAMRPGSMYLMKMEAADSVTPIKMSILTMEHAAFVIQLEVSFKPTHANLALKTAWLANCKPHAKSAMSKKIISFPTAFARNAIWKAAWTV